VQQWVCAQQAEALLLLPPSALGTAAELAVAATVRRACACKVASGVLDALAAAHAVGIAHCDVRPANVVIADGGTPVLIDWGSSCALGESVHYRCVPAYASDRVCRGEVVAHPLIDVVGALYTWVSIA
jgi:serine/threonine protein kinase